VLRPGGEVSVFLKATPLVILLNEVGSWARRGSPNYVDCSSTPRCRTAAIRWGPRYLALRVGDMSTTAAFVALGQKLARVCFALLKTGTDFNPAVSEMVCPRE